jgi:hypothetical protein
MYKGEEYETSSNATLLESYDLVEDLTTVNPETNGTSGTLNENVEVTYYYKLKEYNITTKVNPTTISILNENTNEEEEVTIQGGTISGENENPYETVVYGNDSKKEIIITPDNGFVVKSITINGENIEYTTNEDGTVNLSKFVNVTEDKEVVVEFEAVLGKVIVHHYIEGTTTPVPLEDGKNAEDEIKNGYVGNSYATKAKEDISEKYEFLSVSGNTSGSYTKDTIEVTYYYIQTISQVTIKYIDKITGEEIDEDIIKGKIGEEYTVSAKEIEGYTVVEVPDELTGIYTNEEQEKIFYYAKNASVKVKYIDINTNEEIVESEIINGYEGKEYTTTAKDFESYVLIETDSEGNSMLPENASGTMQITLNDDGTTNTETIVIYYYAKISAGVIEKHIDIISGEILGNITYEGKEGDPYETSSKEFEGYDLVEVDEEGNSMLPENASGKMTVEAIEVKYYYIRKTRVKVEYIDINSNEEIIKPEGICGHQGDEYTTVAKEFEGYVLVEKDSKGNNKLPINASGIMQVTVDSKGKINTEINVIYYYAKISAGVVEKHIDKISGEVLESTTYEGKEGDPYETSSKEFEGYDLVEKDAEGNSMLPENASGIMTTELIEVKYYYIRKTTVKIKYIDINTNEEIAETEVIEGHQEDEYTTSSKEIENYELLEIPENASGTMQVVLDEDGNESTEILVIYSYVQKTKVTVNYIDIISNDVLDTEITEGLVGDAYISKAKDFDGYVLVETDSEGNSKLPTNAEGTMTKDEIVVNYYYKHISAGVIEKHIDKMNGELLGNKVYKGNEGDPYETSSREFEGYDLLVEDEEGKSMLPENASGTMTQELIEVRYYYIRKTSVRVKYIDVNTKEEIAETVVIEGHKGDDYTTEEKEIENYSIVESMKPKNAEGTMNVTVNEDGSLNTEIEVIYYYEKDIEPEAPVEPDEPTTPEIPDEPITPEIPDDNNEPEDNTNTTNTDNTNTDNTNTNNTNTNTDNTNTNNTNTNSTNTNNTNTNNTNTNNTNNTNTNNSTNNSNNNSNASSNNNSNVTIIEKYIQNSNTNNNTKTNVSPSTGDALPVIAIGTIILVILANIVQIVISRKNK